MPSVLASVMVRQPREMTGAEIADVIERFAVTAQRAEEAGGIRDVDSRLGDCADEGMGLEL